MTAALPAQETSRPAKVIFGRFMLPDTTEHPCQVVVIDETGADFQTSAPPPQGTAIVAYLDEIGRIEARVDTVAEDGCRVSFVLSPSRRERFLAKLEWLQGGGEPDTDHEKRRHTRFEPKDTRSQITMQDGRVYRCEVIDISPSGAAVSTSVMPALGSVVALGKMRGRVVRHLDNGIAVEFASQLDQTTLAQHIR